MFRKSILEHVLMQVYNGQFVRFLVSTIQWDFSVRFLGSAKQCDLVCFVGTICSLFDYFELEDQVLGVFICSTSHAFIKG